MPFEQPPITDLSQILSNSNTQALWTRTVNMSGVKVQKILGDKLFILVGPDSAHSVVGMEAATDAS